VPQKHSKSPPPDWYFDWNYMLAAAAFRLDRGWSVLVIFRVENDDICLADVQIAYSGDLPADADELVPGGSLLYRPFADWVEGRVEACGPTVGRPERDLTVRRLDGIRLGGLVREARSQLTPAYIRYALGVSVRSRRLRVGADVERDLARLAVRFEELQAESTRPLAALAEEEAATYSATRARIERARLLGLLTRPGKGQRGVSSATERAKGLI
jgi:hypothetical protein